MGDEIERLVKKVKKSGVSESESRDVRRSSQERLREKEAEYRRSHAPGGLPDNFQGGE